MELDRDVFDNEWQRVAVDKAKPVYEQAQELLAYAESLQYTTSRLNASRDAAIAAAVHMMRAFNTPVSQPQGEKHEKNFDILTDALGFAALVNGVCHFWNEQPGYKVTWFTYNEKEINS